MPITIYLAVNTAVATHVYNKYSDIMLITFNW